MEPLTARAPYPQTIVQGEDAEVRLYLVRDGVAIQPDDLGEVRVIDSAGSVVLTDSAPAYNLLDGYVAGNFAAAVTADLELGQLFQVRFVLIVESGQAVRTFRREAVVAPFALVPPVADADLTVGNYPDLVDQLAGYGTTLQPFIDEAWGDFLRKLFKVGRWPDRLISTADAFDPVREDAWHRVFRFLFSKTSGDGRFEMLMNKHGAAASKAMSTMSGRWDNDDDGVADDLDRDAAASVLHRNGAPRARLSHRRRW